MDREYCLVPKTLSEFVTSRAVREPERIGYTFLDSRGRRFSETYADLARKVAELAARVREISAPGDRILLLCPPGLDMVHAIFACLAIRRIAVPLAVPVSQWHAETVAAIARDSAAVAILTISPLLSLAKDLPGMANTPLIDCAAIDDDNVPDIRELDVEAPGPDDIAYLQYTSGSTGDPRGVIVRHRNILHNVEIQRRVFGQNSESTAVFWLPPSHDMGLVLGILSPMVIGFPVTLLSPQTFLRHPMWWLREISAHPHVTAGGPNLAYGVCVNRITEQQAAELDLSQWDVALVGAEPVNPRILRIFCEKFAVSGFRPEQLTPAYGLAEGTLYVSGGPRASGLRTRRVSRGALEQGTVEQVPDGREIVVLGSVDPDSVAIVDGASSRRVSAEVVGEVWVRSESVCSGYWEKPRHTARTFGGRLADDGSDGWLRTGDLGFVLDGELHVCGRDKELMIINGRNLFPQDIEWSVEAEYAAVRRGGCAVFSTSIAGDESLVVVAEIDSEITEVTAENIAELSDSIAIWIGNEHGVVPHEVIVAEKGQIAKTTSGKIRRAQLRERYAKGTIRAIETDSVVLVSEMGA